MGIRCSHCFQHQPEDAPSAKRPRHSRPLDLSMDTQQFKPTVFVENEAGRFFTEEATCAPILVRNDCVNATNFVEWQRHALALLPYIPCNQEHEAALARGSDAIRAEAFDDHTQANIAEFRRIHAQDAARAVSVERRRHCFQQLLRMVHWNLRDYHQGGGFICAFLAIFLPANDVCRVMWHLNENQMQGYFQGEPIEFVSDAVVFHRLVRQKRPTLCAHMERLGINPEATHMYCSRWFSCMAVHFAPFSCVFQFARMMLTYGIDYLFQFGLAWLQYWEDLLMATTNQSELVLMLRNEHPEDQKKWHPSLFVTMEEQVEVFEQIITRAVAVDLSEFEQFAAMRKREKTAYKELIVARKARAAALAVDISDLEFSDEED